MRDLAKDSRWLQRQEPNRDNHISVNFYRAYDWLNQAIRAEAEVEHYRDELVKYEQALKFACAYVQSKIGGKVDEYMEYYLEQAEKEGKA